VLDTGDYTMITLDTVRTAAARIAPHVRRTPLVSARALKDDPYPDGQLLLKLECLQATGSFKARGATNKLLSLTDEEVQRGLITASGGNHGLATAYAGWLGKTKTTVYLPESASPEKAKKLADWGARVVFKGSVWDEANREALAVAEREGLTYFHPFADPVVIAGQGTTALESLEQEPDVDDFVVAIGGGGLISGIALTVKALRPAARIIGVEPTGAPTLSASLKAGRVVALPAITTSVATLAAMQTEPINLQIVQRYVEDIVLVTDDDMREAARWLWFEMGLATDLSGAAAVAALRAGRFRPAPGRRVCALVCGAGSDALAGR
jgi:threonine dehydratase